METKTENPRVKARDPEIFDLTYKGRTVPVKVQETAVMSEGLRFAMMLDDGTLRVSKNAPLHMLLQAMFIVAEHYDKKNREPLDNTGCA